MDNNDYRLLVVDDNEMNRDMLTRRLRRAGYRVGEAVDGQAAIEKLKTGLFDLMLLDIMMPIMDGLQVLEHLQARDDIRAIPIIMLTAVQDKAQVVHCLKLGASGYVVKPFDKDQLLARIEEALSAKQQG